MRDSMIVEERNDCERPESEKGRSIVIPLQESSAGSASEAVSPVHVSANNNNNTKEKNAIEKNAKATLGEKYGETLKENHPDYGGLVALAAVLEDAAALDEQPSDLPAPAMHKTLHPSSSESRVGVEGANDPCRVNSDAQEESQVKAHHPLLGSVRRDLEGHDSRTAERMKRRRRTAAHAVASAKAGDEAEGEQGKVRGGRGRGGRGRGGRGGKCTTSRRQTQVAIGMHGKGVWEGGGEENIHGDGPAAMIADIAQKLLKGFEAL